MNKKFTMPNKIIILFILAIGISALGKAYASWNSNLNITTQCSTGSMNILFYDNTEKEHLAHITDLYGNDILLIESEFTLEDDGKSLKVIFKDGLPIKELLNGNFIKIQSSLKMAEDSSINSIKSTVLDIDKPNKDKITMKAERALIAIDGIPYSIPTITESFMAPLSFDFYNVIENDNENMGSTLYLKLDKESMDYINSLPKNLSVNYEELEKSKEVKSSVEEERLSSIAGNGVIITYSCNIPIFIDQKEAETTSNEGGK